jgi:hypothetical protein
MRLETRCPPTTNEDRCEVMRYYSLGREDGGLGSRCLFSSVKQQPDTWQSQGASPCRNTNLPHTKIHADKQACSQTEKLNSWQWIPMLFEELASSQGIRPPLRTSEKRCFYTTRHLYTKHITKNVFKNLIQFSSLLLLITRAKMFQCFILTLTVIQFLTWKTKLRN